MVLKSWLWCSVLGLVLTAAIWGVSNNKEATSYSDIEEKVSQSSGESVEKPLFLAQEDTVANEAVLAAIAPNQVIYLAETHDDPADHAAQLQIIQTLSEQGDIAIALEMFQRPFQSALDGYLSGQLSETELIAASEYETRWGFDWEFYAPILRYAKENSIPLIALNTPAEITRKVATSGLESLAGEELTYIPPISDIDLSNADYKEQIANIFSAHGGMGHSLNIDNFFAAQVLWDETMAEGIAMQIEAQPDRQVIVLAGEGHILYDYGIPDRVERRVPSIKQSSVRLIPSQPEENPSESQPASDFVWITNAQ